jgi:hypothetical protein
MHSCRRRQGGEGESSVSSKVFLRQMQQGLLPLRGHGEGGVAREMPCAGGSEVNVEGATRSVVLIHDENVVELDVPVRHTEFVQVGGYLENRSGELKSAVGVKTIEVVGCCRTRPERGIEKQCWWNSENGNKGLRCQPRPRLAETEKHCSCWQDLLRSIIKIREPTKESE